MLTADELVKILTDMVESNNKQKNQLSFIKKMSTDKSITSGLEKWLTILTPDKEHLENEKKKKLLILCEKIKNEQGLKFTLALPKTLEAFKKLEPENEEWQTFCKDLSPLVEKIESQTLRLFNRDKKTLLQEQKKTEETQSQKIVELEKQVATLLKRVATLESVQKLQSANHNDSKSQMKTGLFK